MQVIFNYIFFKRGRLWKPRFHFLFLVESQVRCDRRCANWGLRLIAGNTLQGHRSFCLENRFNRFLSVRWSRCIQYFDSWSRWRFCCESTNYVRCVFKILMLRMLTVCNYFPQTNQYTPALAFSFMLKVGEMAHSTRPSFLRHIRCVIIHLYVGHAHTMVWNFDPFALVRSLLSCSTAWR